MDGTAVISTPLDAGEAGSTRKPEASGAQEPLVISTQPPEREDGPGASPDELLEAAEEQKGAGDTEADLLEMLRDESEDEDEQVNYEMDDYRTAWITLGASHGYRAELRERLKREAGLTDEERRATEKVHREADFWLGKGIATNHADQVQASAQCYKQALTLNPGNFLAMFNLAASYERLSKLGSALRWFRQATKVKPDFEIAHEGAALNLFKLGRYAEAAKCLRACIDIYAEARTATLAAQAQARASRSAHYATRSGASAASQSFEPGATAQSQRVLEDADADPKDRATSTSYQSLINDCNFKLALCLRRQEKWDEAGALYGETLRFVRCAERAALVNSLFGVILLPMVQDRRMIADELETLRDCLMEYKGARKAVPRPLHGTFFDVQAQRWRHPKDAALELHTRSFFCRFPPEDLQRFLPKMVVRHHPAGSAIFADAQVCVVLGGMVESKQHLAGRRVPLPVNKFRRGDILGFDQGDGGQTSNVNTWSTCASAVEAIWMEPGDFADLWHLQNKHPRKLVCDVIRMQACFAACTDVTLHMLAFELLELRRFKPGEIMVRQNKRSPVNEHHAPYLVSQTNALMSSALQARDSIDRYGYDSRVSNFQLLLKEVARNAKTVMAIKNMRRMGTLSGEVMQKAMENVKLLAAAESPQLSPELAGLRRTSSLIIRPGVSLAASLKAAKALGVEEAGLYIIEQGRAQIVCTRHETKAGVDDEGRSVHTRERQRITISAISRGDSFGGTSVLKRPGLDYLGDIVAGAAVTEVRGAHTKPDKEVTCYYLSAEDFRRLRSTARTQFVRQVELQAMPFFSIAARVFDMPANEINKY